MEKMQVHFDFMHKGKVLHTNFCKFAGAQNATTNSSKKKNVKLKVYLKKTSGVNGGPINCRM